MRGTEVGAEVGTEVGTTRDPSHRFRNFVTMEGAHSSSVVELSPAQQQGRAWKLVLSPWTEVQRALVRCIGNDASLTALYALRVDASKLECFLVLRIPRRASWLAEHIVQGDWRQALAPRSNDGRRELLAWYEEGCDYTAQGRRTVVAPSEQPSVCAALASPATSAASAASASDSSAACAASAASSAASASAASAASPASPASAASAGLLSVTPDELADFGLPPLAAVPVDAMPPTRLPLPHLPPPPPLPPLPDPAAAAHPMPTASPYAAKKLFRAPATSRSTSIEQLVHERAWQAEAERAWQAEAALQQLSALADQLPDDPCVDHGSDSSTVQWDGSLSAADKHMNSMHIGVSVCAKHNLRAYAAQKRAAEERAAARRTAAERRAAWKRKKEAEERDFWQQPGNDYDLWLDMYFESSGRYR